MAAEHLGLPADLFHIWQHGVLREKGNQTKFTKDKYIVIVALVSEMPLF
jgi:hypothetical protein